MQERQVKHIIIGVLLLITIVFIGVIGYMALEGFTFTEALFMTVITISTVGYEEVHQLDDPGMVFTSVLIIFSFGIFIYVVTSFTRFLIEGVFRNYYKDNKVKKRVQRLKDHVIVCGFGRNGRQAAVELIDHNKKFVIIDKSHDRVDIIREETDYLYIEGDATQEETLEAAMINTASALITAMPNDADNLFVVLTARQMNKKLKIISRASEEKSDTKLRRAGADNVIMPDRIGGQRMAKLVVQPDVVEFLEYIMLQSSDDVNLEELSCQNMAFCFINKSIKELGVRNVTGANIVGLKKDNAYIFNPTPDVILSANDQLFVLGDPQQLEKLRQLLEKGDM
ncbi:MAG: potassium channel protein [Bacteroidales bacterium]|nr:potassium channel protein [Bacteroidales bacterium]